MIKRNKRGQFKKGVSGNPTGRGKKKDSPVPTSKEIRDAFYQAFVEIFVKSGSTKELVDFCKRNQLNQRLLIQEVRKILPDLATEREDAGIGSIQIVSAVPRATDTDAVMRRKIRDLEARIEDQDEELRKLKGITTIPVIEELKHEPVRPGALPKHEQTDEEVDEEISTMSDEVLDEEIKRVKKELRE